VQGGGSDYDLVGSGSYGDDTRLNSADAWPMAQEGWAVQISVNSASDGGEPDGSASGQAWCARPHC
jgi:hypothetical protein